MLLHSFPTSLSPSRLVNPKHNEGPQFLRNSWVRYLTFRSQLQTKSGKMRTRTIIVQHISGLSCIVTHKYSVFTSLSLIYSRTDWWLMVIHDLSNLVNVQHTNGASRTRSNLMVIPSGIMAGFYLSSRLLRL